MSKPTPSSLFTHAFFDNSSETHHPDGKKLLQALAANDPPGLSRHLARWQQLHGGVEGGSFQMDTDLGELYLGAVYLGAFRLRCAVEKYFELSRIGGASPDQDWWSIGFQSEIVSGSQRSHMYGDSNSYVRWKP